MPVVKHACQVVGIERSTAYRARCADEEFAKAWDDAMEDGIDGAEREAFRRAVEGWEEPVFTRSGYPVEMKRRIVREDGAVDYEPVLDADGQHVHVTVRKHSDTLLAFVLKGRRKSVYAERIEQTGPGGGPVQQTVIVTGIPHPGDVEPPKE